MLVLTRNEVEELLDLDALPDALAVAHAELSGGQASLVPRIRADLATRSGSVSCILIGALAGRSRA